MLNCIVPVASVESETYFHTLADVEEQHLEYLRPGSADISDFIPTIDWAFGINVKVWIVSLASIGNVCEMREALLVTNTFTP